MCAKEKIKLHPSVSQFKEFVQKHPKMIKDVRQGNKTWQQLYQDWFLVGEEDEVWNEYRTEEEMMLMEQEAEEEQPNSKMLGKVMSFFRNIDPEQMQGQMNNLQNIATNIQQLVGIFRGTEEIKEEVKQTNPFTFQND